MPKPSHVCRVSGGAFVRRCRPRRISAPHGLTRRLHAAERFGATNKCGQRCHAAGCTPFLSGCVDVGNTSATAESLTPLRVRDSRRGRPGSPRLARCWTDRRHCSSESLHVSCRAPGGSSHMGRAQVWRDACDRPPRRVRGAPGLSHKAAASRTHRGNSPPHREIQRDQQPPSSLGRAAATFFCEILR